MLRRDFLMQAGLLTGSMLLHNEMAQAFSHVGGKRINVGVIGTGDRGKGLIDTMKELPNSFKVTAICDVMDFRLREAQEISGLSNLKQLTDYRKLLKDKSIDAVFIATPLHLHYPITVAALEAGKHVYLEKTMTYNIDEAKSLVSLSKKYPKLTLQVGHQYRYTPLYYRVKDMIQKGYLGKVTQIESRWDRNWNWRRPVPDPSLERQINWRMYQEYSGGLIAELLSHQMDFVNWAFDTHPDEIFGTGGVDIYKDGRETLDNVQVMLRYAKDNMIGNFGATCGNAKDGYLFRLKGTKGTISLLMDDAIFYPEKQTAAELETVDGVTGATKIAWNSDGGIPILKEKLKDGTWYALEDFHKSVNTGQLPASNVATGATTAVCVHLANQSIVQHEIKSWKPEYNF
ncbi:putative dehydrogenase [Arcticibacter pallidicorallinus]|uniref:Putative dehydrogenase n=2 Tax=Arcticibacter pallidicorallinus TaxID=1259464 RepID=A0A2T0U0X5_9SPHI|nr:putative dehydrogenase [Arcticibacter pallidicorallinus]